MTNYQKYLAGAVVLASVGDIMSTLIGFHYGLEEKNLLISWFLEKSLIGFAAIKLVVPISLYMGAIWLCNTIPRSGAFRYTLAVRSPNIVAYIMIGAYGLVTINNLVMLAILLWMTK